MTHLRGILHSDKPQIDDIYNKYFNHNEYPDFFDERKFRGPFVVTDAEGKIILAGGIQTIAEATVVTDQSMPVRARQEALFQAMGSTVLISRGMGYKQMHVFVNNDEQYVRHLQKFGFKLIDAKLLVLGLGE